MSDEFGDGDYTALDDAIDVFWRLGHEGASLTELAEAMDRLDRAVDVTLVGPAILLQTARLTADELRGAHGMIWDGALPHCSISSQ